MPKPFLQQVLEPVKEPLQFFDKNYHDPGKVSDTIGDVTGLPLRLANLIVGILAVCGIVAWAVLKEILTFLGLIRAPLTIAYEVYAAFNELADHKTRPTEASDLKDKRTGGHWLPLWFRQNYFWHKKKVGFHISNAVALTVMFIAAAKLLVPFFSMVAGLLGVTAAVSAPIIAAITPFVVPIAVCAFAFPGIARWSWILSDLHFARRAIHQRFSKVNFERVENAIDKIQPFINLLDPKKQQFSTLKNIIQAHGKTQLFSERAELQEELNALQDYKKKLENDKNLLARNARINQWIEHDGALTNNILKDCADFYTEGREFRKKFQEVHRRMLQICNDFEEVVQSLRAKKDVSRYTEAAKTLQQIKLGCYKFKQDMDSYCTHREELRETYQKLKGQHSSERTTELKTALRQNLRDEGLYKTELSNNTEKRVQGAGYLVAYLCLGVTAVCGLAGAITVATGGVGAAALGVAAGVSIVLASVVMCTMVGWRIYREVTEGNKAAAEERAAQEHWSKAKSKQVFQPERVIQLEQKSPTKESTPTQEVRIEIVTTPKPPLEQKRLRRPSSGEQVQVDTNTPKSSPEEERLLSKSHKDNSNMGACLTGIFSWFSPQKPGLHAPNLPLVSSTSDLKLN